MKKIILTLSVLFILIGVLYASYVLWYLPALIRTNEDRLPAIQQAILEISKDQILLSQTISDITDRMINSGKGKEAMVREMLANSVINRLALNYMGADFSTQKSMFLGQIKHIKSVGKIQTDMLKKKSDAEKELKDKLRNLESKKKFLLMTRGSAISGGRHGHEQWAVWQREMHDLNSQIYELRDLVLGQKLQQGTIKDSREDTKANQANSIFTISAEYERNTVVQLERVIASRRMAYMKDESTVVMLRERLNAISVWPLSLLVENNRKGI
jgi:hypothetical protein